MQETYPNSLNPYGKENFILDKIARGSVNTTFNETQKVEAVREIGTTTMKTEPYDYI